MVNTDIIDCRIIFYVGLFRYNRTRRAFSQQRHTHFILFQIHIIIYDVEGERNPNMESLYDYGSRAGFWRLHRLFTSRKIPVTVFAVGMVRCVSVLFNCILVFVL
jgi:hypothetical protein